MLCVSGSSPFQVIKCWSLDLFVFFVLLVFGVFFALRFVLGLFLYVWGFGLVLFLLFGGSVFVFSVCLVGFWNFFFFFVFFGRVVGVF